MFLALKLRLFVFLEYLVIFSFLYKLKNRINQKLLQFSLELFLIEHLDWNQVIKCNRNLLLT